MTMSHKLVSSMRSQHENYTDLSLTMYAFLIPKTFAKMFWVFVWCSQGKNVLWFRNSLKSHTWLSCLLHVSLWWLSFRGSQIKMKIIICLLLSALASQKYWKYWSPSSITEILGISGWGGWKHSLKHIQTQRLENGRVSSGNLIWSKADQRTPN